MQKLDPITHPLNCVSLIEASAGTGKTYTIVALYLRLLLNAGENGLSQALTVEQILVMTFTEAATQELKDRIRSRIVEVKALFSDVLNQQLDQPQTQDEFLLALYHGVKHDLPSAVLRLDLAQQDMDTAAIFTIHGFCYRMLMRYAFDSGVHFNLDMGMQDEQQLIQFCREYWRENYYPQNLLLSRFIQQALGSPEAVLARIKADLSGVMPQVRYEERIDNLADFLQKQLAPHLMAVADFKLQWQAAQEDIQSLILTEIRRKSGKRLDGRSYQERYIIPAIQEINRWAKQDDSRLPAKLGHYFSQQKLDQKTKGNEKITHALFSVIDQLMDQADTGYHQNILLWHYIKGVRIKMAAYKAIHNKIDFADLLTYLNTALYAENGGCLAQLIRQQFPFAMIDEFQDTDNEQYQIIKRLYFDRMPEGESGMIMIGDPKQSIYAFRNADIFTYLTAAQHVVQRYTLETNWRSTPSLIGAVNALFSQAKTPFIYPKIQFQAVGAGRENVAIELNGVVQKPCNFLLSTEENNDQVTACAYSIQQWLNAIAQQKLKMSVASIKLQAKDLAVLVRNSHEALAIKDALSKLGIQSVYLSDRSSVLESEWATVMRYLLQTCLNPHYEQNVMTLLATRLFNLNAQQLYHLRQDEQQWELRVERFLAYQRIWQTQGILAMVHRLLQQEQLSAQLLAIPDGERAMTDILHLAEFLQQGASINENEHALLSWFEQQMSSTNTDMDEVRLRLESERNLVKIVTIHKSKGLEYGVVWLPFLGKAVKKPNQNRLARYHAKGDNGLYYDLSGEQQELTLKEQFAEELRLLYVALTRARYQVNIGFSDQMAEKGGWNPLLYLLSEQHRSIDLSNKTPFSMESLLQACLQPQQYSVTALDRLQQDDWQMADMPIPPILQAAQFNGKIENSWRISSFTALFAMQQRNQTRLNRYSVEQSAKSLTYWDSGYDHDQSIDDSLLRFAVPSQVNWGIWHGQDHNPFTFPQGAKVGNALHLLLERIVFNRAVSDENIMATCQTLQLSESWYLPLQQWLQQILQTPLNDDFCLQTLAQHDCLKELGFFISIDKPLQMPVLNQLLQQYHPLAALQSPLQLDQIQGMLRGFVDLICRVNGQYYLLDYKSNFLGEGYQAYSEEMLTQAVAYHRYDLQYLIYTLALHRYLRQRDPHYEYQHHFGGVYYLFLRGMNGADRTTGIYYHKPDYRLIDGLDRLLAGA